MALIGGEKLAAFDEAVVESVIHLVVSSGGKGLRGTLWGVLLAIEIFCSSITDTSFTSVEM